MAHKLKSRLAAIRKLIDIHKQLRAAHTIMLSHAMNPAYPVALLIAAVGVVASSLPAYSAGDSRVTPRIPVAGGPSVDVVCLDLFSIDHDRREAQLRRWRCPVNLNADGTIDHRRPRQ